MWPSFIWKQVLKNPNVLSIYGDRVWCLIPSQWRHWWIESVKEYIAPRNGNDYSNVTLNFPHPAIVDRSLDQIEMIADISSFNLGRIMDTMNKHLIPDVLCPWGCSEYIHKVGTVSLDIIIQRFLPKCILHLPNKDKVFLVESCRDDFLLRDSEYEKWLFNPDWKVLPSVTIGDNTGPMVCTCRSHSGGTKDLYIHPPRQKDHILPSSKGDQLCHAVIRPRTIKPLKASKYCTTYQMHEQRGSFQGIDTCDVRDFGDFSFTSKLLDESEARSVALRPDINSLLTKLQKDHHVPEEFVQQKRERAQLLCHDVSLYDEYLHGSTYVPLEDALIMQSYLCRSQDIEVFVRSTNQNNEDVSYQRKSKRNWPRIIYPLQKYDKGGYGATVENVPQLKTKDSNNNTTTRDSKVAWCLLCMVSQCKEIWSVLNEKTAVFDTESWEAWILLYLSNKCFRSSKQIVRNSPFKFNQVSTFEKLSSKLDKFEFQSNNTNGLSKVLQVKDVHQFFQYNEYAYTTESFRNARIGTNCETQDIIIVSAGKEEFESGSFVHDKFTIKRKIQNGNSNGTGSGSRRSDNDNDNDSDSDSNSDSMSESANETYQSYIYELRCLITVDSEIEHKWVGNCYTRHGTEMFPSWWTQGRSTKPHHSHNFDMQNVNFYGHNIAIYCKVKTDNQVSNEKRNEFLSYIGGQLHIQCGEHKMPMISSGKTEKKCQKCNKRKEYISCPNLNCNVRLCKPCSSELDPNILVHFIDPVDDDNNDAFNDNNNIADSASLSSNESLIEPHDDGSQDFSFSLDEQEECFLSTRQTETLTGEDIDQYVTTANEEYNDDFDDLSEIDDEDFEGQLDDLPTTNAGEYAFEIVEDKPIGKYISGHVILNQCGSLLTRAKHRINGFSLQRNFLQSIASTKVGESLPLLFPEGMLFPSIFYKMVEKDGSICGAIPSSLFTGNKSDHGFATIQDHIKSRLTNPSSSTSTTPSYISYSYDKITNLTMNHQDSRIVLNRGLTVDKEEKNGIGVRGKSDTALFEALDSKRAAKSLCAAQTKHDFTYFLTFTCNQEKHFGIKKLRQHLKSSNWKDQIPNWFNLNEEERVEYSKALEQSAAGLLLRNWMEVRKVFFEYILRTKEGPFKHVISIFARDEYQPEKGNLSHNHSIIEMKVNDMSEDDLEYINDLVRAQIFDIVRHEEAQELIDHGIFKKYEDKFETEEIAEICLCHKCNQRCLVRIKPGNTPECFKCKKLNNVKISPDNTKHCFIPLPVNLSTECKEILARVGLMEPTTILENGYESPPVFHHPIFKPTRHVPPTNPTNDKNISPVIGYTFAATQSMQNCQVLTLANGANKYVVKYISKIDEQNRVIISVDVHRNGVLISQSTFLHNTKVNTSKINEEKHLEKQRNKDHPRGRAISLMEMLQVMLEYPEVYTNLVFEHIPTQPLELRPGVEVTKKRNNNEDAADAAQVVSDIASIRRNKFPTQTSRHLRDPEQLILIGAVDSSISIDKITKFSLRPPELRYLFNQVGIYYRFFCTNGRRIKSSDLDEVLKSDIQKSPWIDGLHYQVKVRDKALPEVAKWLEENFEDRDAINDPTTKEMVNLFDRIISLKNQDEDELNEEDASFVKYANKVFIHTDTRDHLPVPVYNYTKPSLGAQFILHLLLSMGKFETEYDLTHHENLRECLRYATLIGPENDEESLKEYSTSLLHRYIIEQLVFFPNSMRQLDTFITDAAHILDSVIIHDEIPITDLPPVLQASIEEYNDTKLKNKWNEATEKVVTAALHELAPAIELCNIPPKEELLGATRENPLEWDLLASFQKSDIQSNESFAEQKLAVDVCVDSIRNFANPAHTNYVKNTVITGAPGCGKTYVMSILALYARSQGLNVFPTSLQAKRANQLGGIHIHSLFCLDINHRMSPHRMAELAIIKILRDPVKERFIRTVHMLNLDEASNLAAETLSVIDIICRKIRVTNLPFGGIYINGTMDASQFLSITGRPFLLSSLILTSFKMIKLCHSVRAANDPNFQRLQIIARMHPDDITEERTTEFQNLCSRVFTFVPTWENSVICPNTHRLYSRKSPAREETDRYISQVKAQLNQADIRISTSNDVENPIYSHREWQNASPTTTTKLDKLVKEPKNLIFFKGATFEFTFNKPGQFQHSQICVLTELPNQETIQNFQPIEVVAAPPGVQEVHYNPDKTTNEYINEGWKKINIGRCRESTQRISSHIQGQRRQYGLRHRVTSTIHSCLGDTVYKVATEISSDGDWWDKAQVVVATSRTREGKNTIFVGNKESTIKSLTRLIKMKNQWTDYMEEVLRLTTVNHTGNEHPRRSFQPSETFPFELSSVSLPNDSTGFVYFLISLKDPNFTYIGETRNIAHRLRQHNSGYGCSATSSSTRRPFAVFAYICGFNGDKRRQQFVEQKWKETRDNLRSNNIHCVKRWAICAQDVVDNINTNMNFNNDASGELRLILLFS